MLADRFARIDSISRPLKYGPEFNPNYRPYFYNSMKIETDIKPNELVDVMVNEAKTIITLER